MIERVGFEAAFHTLAAFSACAAILAGGLVLHLRKVSVERQRALGDQTALG